MDDELFKFVFRLFDPKGVGTVDADAFVAATALLTTTKHEHLNDQALRRTPPKPRCLYTRREGF